MKTNRQDTVTLKESLRAKQAELITSGVGGGAPGSSEVLHIF